METTENALELMDLIICPGFCVRNHTIIRVNEAASRAFLEPGMDVLPLLSSGLQEYENFREGCLYLTLNLAGKVQGAVVTCVGDFHVFLADEETELRELQVLALAARELRMPLTNVILSAEQLGKVQETDFSRDSAARLNRGTAQLQRLICNMSDAIRYMSGRRLQIRNITSLMQEIADKAQLFCEKAGVAFTYEGPGEDIFTLLDEEQLERAFYNLISNSLKFTPEGGNICTRLTRKGKLLQITVQDSGSGIADGILKSIFTRYLRQPSLEDSRFGLGLGMVLIRAAARNHGGTVLVERSSEGAVVSMTLAIRSSSDTTLHSPILSVDYAGERDHGLLELSENLPAELYLEQ